MQWRIDCAPSAPSTRTSGTPGMSAYQHAYRQYLVQRPTGRRGQTLCRSMAGRLTSRNGIFLVKLTVAHLFHKFHAFYETQRFVTVSATVRYLSLWSARLIHPHHSYLKAHSNIILPSRHRSCRWSLSFKFPHRKPVRDFLLHHTFYMARQSNHP